MTTDRLAALLDVLREANNVIENNYGPDPSLVYDVKRWQKFQRAVNRANDLAAAGATVGLDVERLDAAICNHDHDPLAPLDIKPQHLQLATYRSCAAAIARAYAATTAQPTEEADRG